MPIMASDRMVATICISTMCIHFCMAKLVISIFYLHVINDNTGAHKSCILHAEKSKLKLMTYILSLSLVV